MVMGVSSYTGKSGKRRRRRIREGSPLPSTPVLPRPPRLPRLRLPAWPGRSNRPKTPPPPVSEAAPALESLGASITGMGDLTRAGLEQANRVWRWLKPVLSVVAVGHLVLIALFPGGGNQLFGISKEQGPRYLTPFQVGDTMGFERGRDGFLLFKVFTQNGGIVQGVYPDDKFLPRMRQDRWAAAGHAASGPHPILHRLILEKILESLPAHPVRLELYSAQYQWDRDSLTFPWPGKGPETVLELKKLGVYNGFTRRWQTSLNPAQAVRQ